MATSAEKTLTPTGLIMEGDYPQIPTSAYARGEMAYQKPVEQSYCEGFHVAEPRHAAACYIPFFPSDLDQAAS